MVSPVVPLNVVFAACPPCSQGTGGQQTPKSRRRKNAEIKFLLNRQTWVQVSSLMGRPDLLTRNPGHLEPGSLWYCGSKLPGISEIL